MTDAISTPLSPPTPDLETVKTAESHSQTSQEAKKTPRPNLLSGSSRNQTNRVEGV